MKYSQQLKKKKNSADFFQAMIFDLDGVITQTRDTHHKAWKEMFNRFFSEKDHKQQTLNEQDYKDYIDGKPRYEGVKSFLKSRGITLPHGNVNDQPGFDTVCALGNLKNKIFNEILDRDGVDVYDDAVEMLRYWRNQNVKTAIVSSSKNCKKILQAAQLQDLFDVRVDGVVSENIGLKGKPDPDIFIEAARRLDARPENSIVFEDAKSGVQAGQKGFFALVVGVDRFNQKKALLQAGADITISDFSDLNLEDPEVLQEYFSRQGTPIFPDNEEIFEKISKSKPVIFLDYDGTLSPIVPRPEDAVLSGEMRETLKKLSRILPVAIVTGRDKQDVEAKVELDEIIYAGSHGYIITGPNGLEMEHPDSERIIPRLDEIEIRVEEYLKNNTRGTQIDRKRYALGIHYRNARPEDEDVVYDLVEKILQEYPDFKKGEGKKILEIKPDLDWHKGKAVNWILEALDLAENENVLPIYIGDDITDEDAFEELKEKGIGIMVGGHGKKTSAPYALKNVFQVREFFKRIIKIFDQQSTETETKKR